MNKNFFKIIHTSKKSGARAGEIHTPHGVIHTPAFVAVGTNGTIKALDSKIVESLGLELMFANTYHLMIQPGTKIISQAGGIHKFMNRNLPIITDSGGFQVFSLTHNNLMFGTQTEELKRKKPKRYNSSVIKITQEGVLFRSYRDGTKILLTPELSIKSQKEIGADIIISLDELPGYYTDPESLARSLERTHRWELRSLEEHKANPSLQFLYCVIHGGPDYSLRKKSCDFLSSHNFDGFSIGGSLGKTHTEMFELLDNIIPYLDEQRPRHLLGIGDLVSLEKIIKQGIDTFDSTHPTKAARHGLLFTPQGNIRVSGSANQTKFSPIFDECTCYTCAHYTLAYLAHLFKAHELTFFTLATIHNLSFMINKTKDYREKILRDEI